MTVEVWLRRWLASRLSLRAETARSYGGHIDDYLVPYLGQVLLAELNRSRVQAMFTQIAVAEGMTGRPVSAATLHRIHATLRAALNEAVRVGLIPMNPAVGVELPSATRPRPMVWTPERVAAWRRDGTRPTVPVWTPTQTAAFLAFVREHRLYALFHLVALTGLRRGEVCGLCWTDVNLDAGVLSVARQRCQTAGRVAVAPPKSRAGVREVALDHTAVTALRQHRYRQQIERAVAGQPCVESGYVFTFADGRALSPDRLTRIFAGVVRASGLPPVTIHGLRHGAATMALAAGAGLKTVQAMLGHSSIQVTADIYSAVLPATAHEAAENTAALLFLLHGPGRKLARVAWRRG
ncbi:site-specific integrase [Catenulispora sp. NF23]|nr:site-specific integrase [Catenulispora pinistramenti]